MGGGSYSSTRRYDSGRTEFFANNSMAENFQEKSMNLAMNPHGIKLRESRDSDEHPESLAIVLALDVTGSMGSIPQYLVGTGLPHLMDKLIEGGIADPQVLFLGIGDHECGDQAPLQVGQFESSDELLDHWLTKLYIEGGGGGNDGESYLLAWYFAGDHTDIDCYNKRKQKGFLFTVGDEKCLPDIQGRRLKKIMGEGEFSNASSAALLDRARAKYHVRHLHLKEGFNGQREEVMDEWKQRMRDDLIVIDHKEAVADKIASLIIDEMSDQPEKTGTFSITPDQPDGVML